MANYMTLGEELNTQDMKFKNVCDFPHDVETRTDSKSGGHGWKLSERAESYATFSHLVLCPGGWHPGC